MIAVLRKIDDLMRSAVPDVTNRDTMKLRTLARSKSDRQDPPRPGLLLSRSYCIDTPRVSVTIGCFDADGLPECIRLQEDDFIISLPGILFHGYSVFHSTWTRQDARVRK